MFNFFKRTKIQDWEIKLLLNVISNLPISTNRFEEQIHNGLFRGVFENASDIIGYTAFTFNSNIFKKYENKLEKPYTLKGIMVYDSISGSFLPYSIYVSSGVINGYSIQGATKFKINPDKFDISKFQRVFDENEEYNEIEVLLNSDEKKMVNPSTVYAVELNGKKYFHLLDLEDGDFIGLDLSKKMYEITHDPFEIIEIKDKSLIQILRGE